MKFLRWIIHQLHLHYLIAKGRIYSREKLFYSKTLDLKLHLKLDHLIDYLIFHNGAFQLEVVRCIDKVINEKGCKTFIDVGSHIGQMSLYVAKNYKTINIIAFEANQALVFRQKENMILNDLSYQIENTAISSQNSPLQFYVNSRRYKEEYLKFNDGKYSAVTPGHEKAFKAEAVTLDHLNSKIQFDSPILIKLDIEGAELEAIKGGSDFFRDNEVIVIIELLFAEYPVQCKEIVTRFEEMHYTLYNLLLQPISIVPSNNGDFAFIKHE